MNLQQNCRNWPKRVKILHSLYQIGHCIEKSTPTSVVTMTSNGDDSFLLCFLRFSSPELACHHHWEDPGIFSLMFSLKKKEAFVLKWGAPVVQPIREGRILVEAVESWTGSALILFWKSRAHDVAIKRWQLEAIELLSNNPHLDLFFAGKTRDCGKEMSFSQPIEAKSLTV